MSSFQYRSTHKEKIKASNARHKSENADIISEYNAVYYRDHSDKIKQRIHAYQKANPEMNRVWEHVSNQNAKTRKNDHAKSIRKKAMLVVANHLGDPVPRCRIDITPNTPVSDLPCRGRLELDHINGGGSKEARERGNHNEIHRAIVNGERGPEGLRPLCVLHQLWNRWGIDKATEWEDS